MNTYRNLLLVAVSALFALGIVMIFNTTSAEVLDLSLHESTHQALFKQFAFALLAFTGGSFLWRVGYRRFLEFSPLLLLIFSILLLFCLLPGIGHEVNGSKRWIHLGSLSIQPSEFVKYLIPAFLIAQLQNRWREPKQFFKLFGIVLVPIFLILIEPNNGTVGVIIVSLLVLCFITRVPAKYWALPLACLLAIGAFAAVQLPYVRGRLNVYWNPELDLLGKGHQPHQAKVAAGSGGLWGKGPGQSLQKLSYLPEAQNDYIAAIYAEEFGFVGIMLLILLYVVILYAGFSIAQYLECEQAIFLSTIITFLMTFQAFLNLGVVSGLLPSTGLNLPFFSQGGSSLIAHSMGIGLLLSLSEEAKCRGMY